MFSHLLKCWVVTAVGKETHYADVSNHLIAVLQMVYSHLEGAVTFGDRDQDGLQLVRGREQTHRGERETERGTDLGRVSQHQLSRMNKRPCLPGSVPFNAVSQATSLATSSLIRPIQSWPWSVGGEGGQTQDDDCEVEGWWQ